ncbi:MAG TPA: magnesium transporter [Bacteroidales bacterium]|nr:magnesium transporter [Bacteroidales bacterium]HPF02301.1 magnesium transporter [Bacteroidales bacterium]HPR12231.1 magnesium transporter [Bacteroidales bacterium]HRW86510.1 magnesium transporter [Bacteroidales bacterium]
MFETITEFQELIEKKEWKRLRSELSGLDDVVIAELIDQLDPGEDIVTFRLLTNNQAKNTFQLLSYEKQEQIIEGLARNSSRLSSLLNDLDPDDRTAFFEELPGQVSQRLIQLLSPEERKITIQLLGYPEDSIGRLMTPEFVAVKSYFTVAQTLEHIRKFGHNSETLNVIYIVDDTWRLIDDIKIRHIILADPGQTISELQDNRYISLNAYDDQESAIRVFKDHDRVALPVTDSDGILVGIVTFDDIMDVEEEEVTEDFHKFGSFQEAIINPLKARATFLYQKRILWLTVLVFMNIFSGVAISGFENVIQSMVSLMFFLPLLIGSGGNAGSQSATLMIRSLATGEVEAKDWFRLAGKELLVSFLLGATMAAGVSLIAIFREPQIIPVVATTMVVAVMAGSLVGLTIPFVFTKLKIDPATASAPLITSVADILGVWIYFSLAAWVFGL